MSVQAPNGASWAQGYTYDTARRLASVTSPAGAFNYQYNDGADVGWVGDPYTGITYDLHKHSGALVQELTLPNGAYITNTFDSVARLTGTWLMNSGATNLDSYVYTYNQANQRTNVVRTAGDYVTYKYDSIGELTNSIGFQPSGAVRIHERRYYAYDGAGNLLQKKDSAAPMFQTIYGINSLNEITNSVLGTWNALVGWSATISVAGSTTSPATNVTVNGASVNLYGDNSFAWNFGVNAGSNGFTAIARDIYGRSSTNVSAVSVIPTNNAYAYDLNGNLLTDGTRNFAYDDENQLSSVWKTNAWRNDFAYDGRLRKRIERDYMWSGSAWQQTNEIHYIYDGNLVIQERDANDSPQVTYTRGSDLSGSLQGDGGIGGLLARTDHASAIPWIVPAGGAKVR